MNVDWQACTFMRLSRWWAIMDEECDFEELAALLDEDDKQNVQEETAFSSGNCNSTNTNYFS